MRRCLWGTPNPLQKHFQKGLERKGYIFKLICDAICDILWLFIFVGSDQTCQDRANAPKNLAQTTLERFHRLEDCCFSDLPGDGFAGWIEAQQKEGWFFVEKLEYTPEIWSLISKMMGLAKGIPVSDEGIWNIYSMLNLRVLLVHESFLVWSSMNLTNPPNVLDSAGKFHICVNFYGRICEKFYPPGN